MGSIGGTIFIGAMVVLFLFLKKRRSNVANQLPDFADETLDEDLSEKFGGFKKLFGSKATTDTSPGGYNDIERQLNARSQLGGGFNDVNENDFEYRGVTNSNNLESVFRTSGSNTGQNSGGQNSSATSTRGNGHSRYNSVVQPMAPMAEGVVGETDPAVRGYPVREFHDETDPDQISEYEYDDNDIMFANTQAPYLYPEAHSNNSRLRFTEEI